MIDKYEEEVVFNQEELNDFCRIMNLSNTAHDNIDIARLLGYKNCILPVIYTMSISLNILNKNIFIKYDPLEVYREYTCVRPIFVGDVYRMYYVVIDFDKEKNIGTVSIRLKNEKGQICVSGLVKLKLL